MKIACNILFATLFIAACGTHTPTGNIEVADSTEVVGSAAPEKLILKTKREDSDNESETETPDGKIKVWTDEKGKKLFVKNQLGKIEQLINLKKESCRLISSPSISPNGKWIMFNFLFNGKTITSISKITETRMFVSITDKDFVSFGNLGQRVNLPEKYFPRVDEWIDEMPAAISTSEIETFNIPDVLPTPKQSLCDVVDCEAKCL